MKTLKSATTLLLIYFSVFPLLAQSGTDTLVYSRQEILITMRDGIKLNTLIYAPDNAKEPMPFLFLRTPYGVSGFSSPDKIEFFKVLAIEGYIFVFQDLRGRFRNSYADPKPVEPNKVYEYRIDLHSINHVFKSEHKIMVQVQSTWFPITDRNPQKFVPNIFEAKESDFIVAK
jgi:predicted acyl esterase